VSPAPDGKTVVVTLTFRPGEMVRAGDEFSLVSKGILGDMYIEDVPAPPDSPQVKEGYLFEGTPFFSLNDLLGGDTMQIISDVGSSLKAIADVVKRNEGNIDSIIQDLQKTAANARVVSQDLATATKTLPDLTKQITTSLDGLQKTLDSLNDSTNKMIASLQGTVTTGSKDLEVSLNNIKQTSADIQVMVNKLAAKDSVIGTLSSSETSRSIEETLKNLQEISASLVKASDDVEKVVAGVREILGPSATPR